MDLLLVGDGPRDCCTVPHLLSNILGCAVNSNFKAWKEIRLTRGTGYERKLMFAAAEARTLGVDGLVTTIDRDTAAARERISQLQKARTEDRAKHSPFPIAIGQADPHGEAWLLDDEKAVREVLKLDAKAPIPNVKSVYPKECLHNLIGDSPRAGEVELDLLSEIALAVDINRCNHRSDTGFSDFAKDVTTELSARAAQHR